MPLDTLIASQTYGTQINDGDPSDSFELDGGSLPYLHGNVTDLVYVETEFLIKWYTELNANKVAQLIVTNNVPNMWLSSSSDFINDGWQVGDEFGFTSGNYSVSGEITSVASNTLIFNVTSSVGITQSMFFTSGNILGINTLDAAIIEYNLIENNAATNYNNATDGTINSYYVSGMNNGSPQNAFPFVNGVNETWIDNTDFNSGVQIKAFNSGLDSNYFQKITVRHTFCLMPFYLQNFNVDLTNGTLPADWFQSNKSIKYIIKLDARPTVGNANSSKVIESTDQYGDVGFFNETFNGLPNYQNVYDLEYNSGANDSLVKVGSNTVTFKIKTNSPSYPNFLSTDIIKANFSLCKNPSDYLPSTRFKEQFLFSTFIKDASDEGKDGPITDLTTTIDAVDNSILHVSMDVDFTSAESNTILSGMFYILNISVKQANYVYSNLLIDYAQFDATTDVDNLVEFYPLDNLTNRMLYLRNGTQDMTDTADSYEAFNGMIEDPYSAEFRIKTKQSSNDGLLSPVNARILDANWQIMARDTATGEEFICQSYAFDLTSSTEIPATNALNPNPTEQSINLSTTRGFNYPVNELLNEVKFEYLATEASPFYGTIYDVKVAFKLNWMEWISNPDVANIFYDGSLPNNNLNQRVSNYSEEQNFELFPVLNLRVGNDEFQENGIDYPASVTDYNMYFPSSIARTYGDDSIPKGNAQVHNCEIDTFKTSDGLSTGGVILGNEDMLIQATFTRIDGQPLGYTNYAGAIRLDIENGGLFSIQELSTLAIRVPLTNGLLKPESGQTRTKMVITPTSVVLTCLTDNTQLASGLNYNVSARLWSSDDQPEPPIGNKEMENNTQKLMEDGTDKILE